MNKSCIYYIEHKSIDEKLFAGICMHSYGRSRCLNSHGNLNAGYCCNKNLSDLIFFIIRDA